MRVIAGEFKGRRVDAVPGDSTRPTTDMVREAIASSVISILENGFEGASFLDAFAGSGAVGIEALSRGAARCTFVDAEPKAISTIESNVKPLPLAKDQVQIIRADTFSLVMPPNSRIDAPVNVSISGMPFDIVFLDPPYAVEPSKIAQFVKILADGGALANGALVAYEMACKKTKRNKWEKKDKHAIPDEVKDVLEILGSDFSVKSVKKYGTTQVAYIVYKMD